MLRQIRLLIFDLDHLVFDCSILKAKALRQSLLGFADAIPQDVRLPDDIDVEEAFLEHGRRWLQSLQIGLGEEDLANLQGAYGVEEERLAAAGMGRIYPGISDLLTVAARDGRATALGAEASRDYLLSVSDRQGLDSLFEMAFCTGEFSAGSADEMFEEIMAHAEVNPSETLALGTRPDYFRAARNLGLLTIGCGWGLHRSESLAEADLQASTMEQIMPAIEKLDEMNLRDGS